MNTRKIQSSLFRILVRLHDRRLTRRELRRLRYECGRFVRDHVVT